MIFARKVLAPGPGTRLMATFRAAPISIRFERFTVFHTSASGGGHDVGERLYALLLREEFSVQSHYRGVL